MEPPAAWKPALLEPEPSDWVGLGTRNNGA